MKILKALQVARGLIAEHNFGDDACQAEACLKEIDEALADFADAGQPFDNPQDNYRLKYLADRVSNVFASGDGQSLSENVKVRRIGDCLPWPWQPMMSVHSATLRDQFAMAALGSHIAGRDGFSAEDIAMCAKACYAFADAMLKVRSK